MVDYKIEDWMNLCWRRNIIESRLIAKDLCETWI